MGTENFAGVWGPITINGKDEKYHIVYVAEYLVVVEFYENGTPLGAHHGLTLPDDKRILLARPLQQADKEEGVWRIYAAELEEPKPNERTKIKNGQFHDLRLDGTEVKRGSWVPPHAT